MLGARSDSGLPHAQGMDAFEEVVAECMREEAERVDCGS